MSPKRFESLTNQKHRPFNQPVTTRFRKSSMFTFWYWPRNPGGDKLNNFFVATSEPSQQSVWERNTQPKHKHYLSRVNGSEENIRFDQIMDGRRVNSCSKVLRWMDKYFSALDFRLFGAGMDQLKITQKTDQPTLDQWWAQQSCSSCA